MMEEEYEEYHYSLGVSCNSSNWFFFFAEIMAGLQLEGDYAKINLKVGDIA